MKLEELFALTASAGVAPVAVTLPEPVDASGLDQSESIRPHMLAELAGKLTKRKSEKLQQVGRAISSAIRGEEFAGVGGRNSTLLLIAHAILEEFPYSDPSTVVDCFRASLSNMADRAPGAPTEREFHSMLVRHQSAAQAKHATLDALVKTAQRYPSPPQAGIPDIPDGAPTAPGALSWRNVIVQHEGSFWLRHPHAAVYGIYCDSKVSLRIDLRRYFLDGGANLIRLTDERGETLPIDEILDTYASNARSLIYDYAKRSAEFDPAKERLTVGFEMGCIDREPIEPVVDPRVERWLLELAGGTENDLAELYDWIAATDQRFITTTSAALALHGDADAGKTLFARALAHTWGLLEPVPLKAAVDRFNGPLWRCPIWFADERMPDELTDAIFREMVQARQRDVEPKGKEKVILRGCSRILIAVNELADIRIGGSQGPKAARAVADRLALFTPTLATRQALDALRTGEGSNDAELMAIVRHLRWVQLNVTPRVQRFLGARADRTKAMVPILLAAVDREPLCFAAIREYLIDFAAWERDYGSTPMHLGKKFPIVSEDGGLWVNSDQLAARCGAQPFRVRNALRPFALEHEPEVDLVFGTYSAGYKSLDLAKLEAGLRCDVIPALTFATRERMIAGGNLRP